MTQVTNKTRLGGILNKACALWFVIVLLAISFILCKYIRSLFTLEIFQVHSKNISSALQVHQCTYGLSCEATFYGLQKT